ncbi:MAG: HNH endonuclease [Acidimicrobiia bacterium]
MIDVRDRADGLRVRETSWLRARRAELVRVQRQARAEELAIVGILDERGALDACEAGAAGVSARVERDTVETARALESLPAIAAVAAEGRLSDEQLAALTQLADETTDRQWADRAPDCSPAELQRLVRKQRTPTAEESLARHRARSLRMWWNAEKTVLHVHGELPDLLGAKVEATINALVEHDRPAKGEPWELRDRRAADALGHLCDVHRSTADDPVPSAVVKLVLVVEVPQHGPAMVGGVALPDEVVEQLRASATIEPVLVDEHGVALAIGRRTAGLSPKKARLVLLRDGSCQCGCGLRHGLEIHHLVPTSWGGTDDISNLAALFPPHHRLYIPHGPYALVGNPNVAGGLRTVVYADLTPEEARRYGLPPPPRRRRE